MREGALPSPRTTKVQHLHPPPMRVPRERGMWVETIESPGRKRSYRVAALLEGQERLTIVRQAAKRSTKEIVVTAQPRTGAHFLMHGGPNR